MTAQNVWALKPWPDRRVASWPARSAPRSTSFFSLINTFDQVAHTWTAVQTFNAAGGDTVASWESSLVPGASSRKLVYEFGATPAMDFLLRLYYSPIRFEFTLNARWNGSQWERDNTSRLAARLVLDNDDLEYQQVLFTVSQPFADSEWAGSNASFYKWTHSGLVGGDSILHSKERQVSSGPLRGYSATEGEWGSTNSNIGGGASFSSGKLPSSPSSVTFFVISSSGLGSGPFNFATNPHGVGWFAGTTGSLPATRYVFLEFTAF